MNASASIEREQVPPMVERVVVILVGAAFLCGYFLTARFVAPRAATSLETPLDAALPFVMELEWIYLLYLLVLFLPAFQIRELGLFKRVVAGYIVIQVLANVIFLAFPTSIVRPDAMIDPTASFLDWTIGLNYVLDPPVNCFPSLHVANAFFIAFVARRLDPAVGRAALGFAISIAISTLFVKHHFVADALAGVALGFAGHRLLVAPHVPAGARREELTYPRKALLAIPGLFAVGVVTIYVLYRNGIGYRWPPQF